MYTINPLSKKNLLLHIHKISNIFPELTSTELVTLMLHSSGLKPPRMGELMSISKKTINSHIENIRVKFQLDNYEEVKQVFELRITLNSHPERYKSLFPEISDELYQCMILVCMGFTIEEIVNREKEKTAELVRRQIEDLKSTYAVDFLLDLRVFFMIRLKLDQAKHG
ncbi:LuxR C-terminal-related transcriptional regulator [Escherichia coli]|nr:LuxR C-terminal-related transcriptional regulator [Escherichia coli]